jgi:hypothetical protein
MAVHDHLNTLDVVDAQPLQYDSINLAWLYMRPKINHGIPSWEARLI